jgi:hypothetical protein
VLLAGDAIRSASRRPHAYAPSAGRDGVCTRTYAAVPLTVPGWRPWGYIGKAKTEVSMLFTLAVILLILAVVGGIAVHPLLFLIAILALLAFFGGRRGTAV